MILFVLSQAAAFPYEQMKQVLDNVPDKLWKARIPEQRRSMEEIKARLMPVMKSPVKTVAEVVTGDAPAELDWRTKNAKCVDTIRNQEQCGSCWAFSAIAAFSDRKCIHDEASERTAYSEEYVIGCDPIDQGCNGGYLNVV